MTSAAPRTQGQADALDGFRRAASPLTEDELAQFLGKPLASIRPRVSDLRGLGLIVATSEWRRSARGKPATVWALAAPVELEPQPEHVAIPRTESAPSIEGPTPVWHWVGRTFSVSREQYDEWFFAFPHIDIALELEAIDDSGAINGDLQQVSRRLSNANDQAKAGDA